MVALKHERHVYLWRVSPHTLPRDAPSVTLSSILEILENAFNEKRAFAYVDASGRVTITRENAENCIFIADYKKSKDGKTCFLLINRGDPDVAHPSFINPSALTVKNLQPDQGEVQGWSAHMAIQTNADGVGAYRAAFERMQNVSSTLVQRYLDALLDKITTDNAEYTYDKPIKKGKRNVVESRPYRIRLGVNKVPSQDLIKDVKTGNLTSITLIRTKPEYNGPGDPTLVNSVRETLTIGTKKLEKTTAVDYIRDVTRWGKNHDYDEVKFRVADLPGNATASPRFAIEKADAMDTVYARTHPIGGFSKLLETCYQTIEDEIAEKMAEQLSNENLWK